MPHNELADLCPPQWLIPIAGDPAQPCGPNLEYDCDYAVLQSRLTPSAQVQYGDFTTETQAPDWAAIERDARALSQRTRDINILIWLTRARTRRAGAQGLVEGLSVLHAAMQQWPDHLHPQMHIDGEHDPQVRANALAALCDPEGLLADIRDIAISTSAVAPLSVKDVERALAVPRSAYNTSTLDPKVVREQLVQMQHKGDARLQSLKDSAQLVQHIAQWNQTHLQQDAPELKPLTQLLGNLLNYDQVPPKVLIEAVDEQPNTQRYTPQVEPQGTDLPIHSWTRAVQGIANSVETGQSPLTHQQSNLVSPHSQREYIRQLMAQVTDWIEENEPSSPVSVLLRQAQHLWGKRYADIAAVIPHELLTKWDEQLRSGDGATKGEITS